MNKIPFNSDIIHGTLFMAYFTDRKILHRSTVYAKDSATGKPVRETFPWREKGIMPLDKSFSDMHTIAVLTGWKVLRWHPELISEKGFDNVPHSP